MVSILLAFNIPTLHAPLLLINHESSIPHLHPHPTHIPRRVLVPVYKSPLEHSAGCSERNQQNGFPLLVEVRVRRCQQRLAGILLADGDGIPLFGERSGEVRRGVKDPVAVVGDSGVDGGDFGGGRFDANSVTMM